MHFTKKKRIPWDWREPFGYVLEFIAQAIEAYFTLYCVPPVIAFMIGSCWLFCAFIEDITSELHVLSTKSKPNGSHNKMKTEFCNIIQLHSDVKQLSDDKLMFSLNSKNLTF